MFEVSEKFLAAMEFQPYIARITLDGVDIIQGDAIEEIIFTGGDNDSTQSIRLGTAVAGGVEVTLQKELTDVAVAGREMFIEIGLMLDGVMEWIPMGRYTATNPTEDDGLLTVPGLDALAAKFDREYEPVDGMNFEQAGGVDALELLKAMCQRRGVAVDSTGLRTAALTPAPTGYTERRIIGMIAAMSGKNAYIDRYGVLRFRWYTEANVTITDDDYYEGGMEKATYVFKVQWLKCYVEPMEETLCEGDPEGEQGIYFECPWVNEEILADLWEQLQGFSYTPTPSLSFQGDPRIEPGDIITMEDSTGNAVAVPIMTITHEYDGGLLTRVAAQGQRKTESYEGPVWREIKRTTATILKKANEIELRVGELDENLSGDELIARINISEGRVKIQANCIELSGVAMTSDIPTNLSQLLNDTDYQDMTGVVTIVNGTVTADYVNALALKVKAANIEGVLAIGQLPEDLALTTDIPENLSQLLNDTGYVDTTGVVTIVNGTVTADFVNALALKVKAANIEGVLAVGQLPDNIALTTDIPENLSQLLNDMDFQDKTGVVTIVNGTVTADFVNALALKVKAANIEGVLAVGQLPDNIALTTDIPENLSQLLNDMDFQNKTGVVTIVNGTVTADFVNALALKVKAANIEGVLAIGQLPDNVAFTSEIPTSLSQLLNDSGYQTQSGVVTIVNGTVTADYVNALALKVKAANIEGTLAVGQLPDGVAFETQIPANLSQLVNDSGYQTSSGVVAIVNGTVTADYVNALALKVTAANITGTLAVGQLPDEVALSTEIPKNLSDLINDSGYLSETGVVAIVNGTVTADYVNALGVTAKYLLVNDTSGNKLFQAGGNAVEMAGWTVNNASLTSGTFGDTYFIGLYSKYSNTDLTIGSVTSNRWRIIAGKSFGVTSDGKLAAADATISGKVTATSGAIGGWTIGDTLTATTVKTAVGVKHTQTVTLTTDGVTVESTWADDENSTLTPTVPSYITLGKKYTKYVTWAELLKVWE